MTDHQVNANFHQCPITGFMELFPASDCLLCRDTQAQASKAEERARSKRWLASSKANVDLLMDAISFLRVKL